MVDELPVAALRAILLYDTDEHVRLLGRIERESLTEQYARLLQVAFAQAVRARFGLDATRGDVIRFVAKVRTGGSSSSVKVDPVAAEQLLRGFLGDREALRGITYENTALIGPLLLELVASLPPDRSAVDEFLAEVVAQADSQEPGAHAPSSAIVASGEPVPTNQLSPDEKAVADFAYEKADTAEQEITTSVRRIAEELEAGRLTGLEERLKGVDSYYAKVADRLAELTDRPSDLSELQRVVDEITDVIRYTYELRPDTYVAGCHTVLGRLADEGFRLQSTHNDWPSEYANGLTTIWRTADGQPFEVRFHTPDSLAAQDLLQPAVRRLRDPRTTEAERADLQRFRRRVAASVIAPHGVTEFGASSTRG